MKNHGSLEKTYSPNSRIGLALLSLLVGASLSAQAATTSWWIVDTGGLWNTPSNWSPQEVPNSPEATAFLNLPGAARIITNDVNVTLGTLWLGDATGGFTYTVTNDPGTTLKFDNNGAGAALFQSGGGSLTDRIATPVELADSLTVSNETATKTLIISGVISETGGSRGIIKRGGGYLTLGTVNNFTGGVTVKAGRLNAAAAGRAGTGVITLGDTSGSEPADLIGNGTYTNSIVVAAGSSGIKMLRNSGTAANATYSGPVTVNDTVEINAGTSTGYTYVSGEISGEGSVVVSSQAGRQATNYIRLRGSNSFTGGITLKSGNLRMSGNDSLGKGTLTINANTILSSDGNSNRQPTNSVVVNGNFTLGHTNGGAGTIRLRGPVDLGSEARTITLGSTVGHYIHGDISGTGALLLQDPNVRGLNLYGSNTFSGGLTILNGNLGFDGDSAFGTGLVTLGSAATATNILVTGNGKVTNDVLLVAGVSGSRTLASTNSGMAHYSGSISLGTDLVLGTPSADFSRTVIVSGPVSGSGALRINGAAPNLVALAGDNTYIGGTVVAGGTLVVSNVTGSATGTGGVTVTNAVLEGTGIVSGEVTLGDNATLAPGASGVGLLTINNSLTMVESSTNVMELNKALGTNDTVAANSVNYNGTLVVNNLAGTLAAGDSFKLFHAGAHSGAFANIIVTDSTLEAQFEAATGILSFVSGGPSSTPTNVTYSVSGNQLSINWPESHKGWYAQSNSVSVGNSNAWYDIPGSESGTSISLPMNSTPEVYFRLRQP